MDSGNWEVSSRPPGKLNLGLNIAQTHERQRKVVRIVGWIHRVFPLLAACLFALGLVLLLSGFSDVRLTNGVVRPSQATARVDAGPELAKVISQRASELQVMTELGDGGSWVKLAIETQAAFENNEDRLNPDYARFLVSIIPFLQMKPDLRLSITGFGNNPATTYNPVLLGKRVRAVQVFFAENGIPIDLIEASVKEADAYEGPNTLLGKAASGQVITVNFVWT